jgi:hypothetical protein
VAPRHAPDRPEPRDDLLTASDGDASWILDGMADEDIEPEALEHAIELRFGRAVAYDPSDPEANRLASAEGYSTLTSNALPKEVWAQVKRTASCAPPVRSRRPSSRTSPGRSATAREAPSSEWTARDAERRRVRPRPRGRAPRDHAGGRRRGRPEGDELRGQLRPADSGGEHALLELNLRRLGHRWFEGDPATRIDQLLYAFAHHHEQDRLSAGFHRAVAALGRDAFVLALREPNRWDEYRPVEAS